MISKGKGIDIRPITFEQGKWVPLVFFPELPVVYNTLTNDLPVSIKLSCCELMSRYQIDN